MAPGSTNVSQPKYFGRLPNEIIRLTLDPLPNRDLKNLRLTCAFFRDATPLRLNRVFFSANPRNIEVFRAVADSDRFRTEVTEVIWDDAHFVRSAPFIHPDLIDQDEDLAETIEGYPRWFTSAREENIETLNSRKRCEVERPDHVARAQQLDAEMPVPAAWAYYQELLRQEDEVLTTGADITTMRYGLQRFPSLRKITITPATHGFLFTPLYETPMIRSFPYGFNYPIPRSWPPNDRYPPAGDPWESLEGAEKDQWRGFRLLTHLLAEEKTRHHITELVLDVYGLWTGLNCRIFEQPCQEYDDWRTLIRRPNFRRLDLPLLIGGQGDDGWPLFRNGCLPMRLTWSISAFMQTSPSIQDCPAVGNMAMACH